MPETTAIRIERTGPPEAFVERQVPLREIGPADVHLRVSIPGWPASWRARRNAFHGMPFCCMLFTRQPSGAPGARHDIVSAFCFPNTP